MMGPTGTRHLGKASACSIVVGIITITLFDRQLFDFNWHIGTKQAGVSRRVDQIRERHLPETRLTDHTGRTVRFYSDLVRDKVVAINFMYAACSKFCELSSQNVSRLQDELGDRLGRQVSLYSISLDPVNDTPEALRAYRDKHGAKPGWIFLTAASVADIANLRRKLGVYEADPALDEDMTQHTGMVLLGNERTGRWTMVPALVHPIRIRQALERVLLPAEQWPHGEAVVNEVPREYSTASEKK